MKALSTIILSVVFSASGFCQKTAVYEKDEYNLGINIEKDVLSILSKNKILLKIEYSFLTSIEESDIPFIHDKYGSNYISNYCTSVVRSVIREHSSICTMEEILFQKRAPVLNNIFNILREIFYKDKIVLEKLLIESITLPPSIQASMEKVMLAEQDVLAQKHMLEKTKITTEIRRIMVKKEAEYNKMLDSTLTERVLQMKYIDVLKKFSETQNSRVIILGNYKLDLPTVLNE